MNKGGTVEVEGITFHMTHALHSGGFIANGDRITYLGDPAGFVIEFENGTKVYAAGDTALFGTGTPEQLREHASGVEILSPEPGETVVL
jgi:L-ascorbate metabolism protein UlaG (beta-lactamase superfamily)